MVYAHFPATQGEFEVLRQAYRVELTSLCCLRAFLEVWVCGVTEVNACTLSCSTVFTFNFLPLRHNLIDTVRGACNLYIWTYPQERADSGRAKFRTEP